jgi:hypothetical protein
MHDVMRKRLMRKLEALPDEQLYQVLDFIEFLESRYAAAAAVEPDGLQRFAERLEDSMRLRALAPRAMSGTMKVIGTAGRIWDNISGAGQGLLSGLESGLDALRPERGAEEERSGGGDRPGGEGAGGAGRAGNAGDDGPGRATG